jgi:neutral ceramidase
LLLTSSHTHTAPIVRSNLIGAYDLDAEQAARVTAYSKLLHERIVSVIGAAIRDLAPANISLVNGTGSFAMNRRELTPQGTIKIGLNPQGVVDHDIPTLIVESLDGKLRGVFFAYACHNTTLTDKIMAVSGDYSGFAQAAFEAAHPNTTAMFAMGCGADINPNPRGTVELGQQHGNALAAAVTKALSNTSSGERLKLAGRFKAAFATIPLAYAKMPTREEFNAMRADKNVFKQRLATRWLARLDREGKLPASYPYPIHALQLGANFTLIALGGEVVTDYVLRLKKELGSSGLMVLGYANEVMAYIPSARMYQEGGYEVVDSMIYYDHPATWTPALEDQIIAKAKAMAAQVP